MTNTKFDFNSGDLVDYSGMQAIVIENHGNKGTVLSDGCILEFIWRYDGTDTVLVKRGVDIVETYKHIGEGDMVESSYGCLYDVVENRGSYAVLKPHDSDELKLYPWELTDFNFRKV